MPDNPYGQELAGAGGAPENPFFSTIEQLDAQDEQQLRTSVAHATTTTPDAAADTLKLSQATGVPVDVVGRNLDAMRRRATIAATPYGDILKQTPVLADWLRQPTQAAAVHDDMEGLGFLEWITSAPGKAFAQTMNQQAYSRLRFASMFRPLTADEHDRLDAYQYAMNAGGALGVGNSWFRKAVTGAGSFLANQVPILEYGAAGALEGAAIGAVGGSVVPGVGTLAGAAAVAPVTGSAGLITGVLKETFQQETAGAYDEYQRYRDEAGRPLDPSVIKAAALATGLINAPIEAGVQELLLHSIPGIRSLSAGAVRGAVQEALLQPTVRAALLDAVKSYGTTLTAETAQEVAQRAVTILFGEAAKATGKAAAVPGQLEPGTFNAYEAPRVENADGSQSTVDSLSVNVDGREVLLPTVTADGRHFEGSQAERAAQALEEYRRTGRHLGIFDTPEHANAFAEQLHNDYAAGTFDQAGKQRDARSILADLATEGLGALQSFALGVLPGPFMDAAHQTTIARQASRNVAFFSALGEGVSSSKTAKRAPDVAQAFLERATKDGPVSTLYAPVDTWSQYWQSKGVDPGQMAAELTGDPDAFDHAQRTGADLAIPTSAYAVKLAGTEHNQFFAQELRLQPDQMNAREAAAFEKDLHEQLATSATEGAAAGVAGEAGPVHAGMLSMLEGAGVERSAAQAYADLYERAFASLGQRAGIDPIELFNRYGLQITREGLPEGVLRGVSEGVSDTVSPGIPESRGTANETSAQAAARMAGHTQALVHLVTRDALRQDPTADADAIARELRFRLEAVREGQQLQAESGRDPGDLLRTIAKFGGLSAAAETGDKGELRHLAESADRNVGRRKAASGIGRQTYSTGKTWKGVAGVFNEQGKSLDGMLEALREEPRFAHLETVNDLLDAVDYALTSSQAHAVDASRLPGSEQLSELGVRLGSRWWEGSGSNVDTNTSDAVDTGEGDASFEFSQGPPDGAAAGARRAYTSPFLEELDRKRQAAGAQEARDLLERIVKSQMLRERHDRNGVFETPASRQLEAERRVEEIARRLTARGVGDAVHTELAQSSAEPVATLTGSELGEGLTDAAAVRAAGIAYYRRELQHGIRQVERPGFGVVMFSDVGKKKIKSTSANPDKMRFIPAIPAIIQHGTYDGRFALTKPRTDGAVAFHHFVGDVVLGVRRERVGVTVSEDRNGNRFYNLNLNPEALRTQQKAPGDTQKQAGAAGPSEDGETTLFQSMAPLDDGINLSFMVDRQAPTILYQPAYHGSPHLFEQFSLHAIGTGEGAQAYGWGLYFASQRAIADFYRKNLVHDASPRFAALTNEENDRLPGWVRDRAASVDRGLAIPSLIADFTDRRIEMQNQLNPEPYSPEEIATAKAEGWGNLLEQPSGRKLTPQELEADIANGFDRLLARGVVQPWNIVRNLNENAEVLRILEKLRDSGNFEHARPNGWLYTVDIPEHDTYLDWDRGVSAQPAHVRETLERAGFHVAGTPNPHQAAATQLLVDDARRAASRGGDEGDRRANEVEALIRKGIADTTAGRRDVATEERLLKLLPNGVVDFNRMLDIANNGVDRAYTDSLINARHAAMVDAKYEDMVDRDVFLPMSQAVVREGEDSDYPYDVVEADGFVVDSYDNQDEAQAAADALNEKAQEAHDRENRTAVSNSVDWDEAARAVYDEVGLGEYGFGSVLKEEHTGEKLYGELIDRTGSDVEASKYLASLGINGIRYLDGSSRSAGEGTHNYVVFDDRLVKIVEYEQNKEDQRRGVIRFGPDRQFKIALLEHADLSTMLHETGHFYLEVLGDLAEHVGQLDPATLTDEQRKLLADYGSILKWLGVENRSDIGVAHHEQFARGFEAYLFEGKAPSVELRNAFARFRSWLVGIYRSLSNLNVQLSDEVRGAFDRMVASDAAIDAAEHEAHITPLFVDAKQAGMTELEFASYMDTVREASQRAREELQARVLSDLKREEYASWKAERAAIQVDVERELADRPIYRALSVMRTGELADGRPLVEGETPRPIKLSRDSLVAQYGREILKRLPRPYVYAADSGIAADTAAELFGFSSGDELVKALIDSTPFRKAVDAEVDNRMIAKHGDIFAQGRLQELARATVEGEHRQTVVQAELRALTRGMVEATIPSADVINHAARERIAGQRIREIRPGQYLMASRRAAARAFKLLSSGEDRAGAVRAKLQELVNLALYREARDAQDRVESMRRTLQAYGSTAARARFGKAGGDYLEQIDAFIERYELARVPPGQLTARTSLRAFAEKLEADGLPVEIPGYLLDDARRVNYQDISLDEFTGVYEAVEQLAHLARLKNQLLKSAKKRTFEEARDTLVSSIRLHNDAQRRPLEFRPADEKWRSIADWFASHTKIATILRALDGHEDGGEMWEAIMRPLNAAADAEETRFETEGAALRALVEEHYPGRELATLNHKQYLEAIGGSLSKEGRLMVALNWGNEGNRSRLLMDPTRGWNQAQIEAILQTLDGRDWKFVQGVWDYIDTFWPEIAAKQKRVTGLAPDKVDAAPFSMRPTGSTETINLRGGYFPLVYDGRLVARAGVLQNTSEAGLLQQASYVKATTRRGHTEARVDNVKMSVRLDLGVLFSHVQNVVHDLTHHEVLVDVSRLLADTEVQQAILETKGDAAYRQLTSALKDIAIGAGQGTTVLDKAATWFRSRTQLAMMGWNLWTAVQQPFGVFNGAARVGPVWVLRGMKRWLRDAATMENTVRWITDVSPLMKHRGATATQDLHDLRAELSKPGGWFDTMVRTVSADAVTQQDILETFLWHIQKAQQVADVPTWLGAYLKAMDAGELEDRAIALADQAVLDSQGGGQIKDLAQVQRGSPIARLLMTFYSYGNTVYNATADAYGQTNFRRLGSVGQFLGNLSLLYAFPAFGTVMLSRMLGRSGGDGDKEGWFAEWARELLSSAMNTMVLVRELSGLIPGSSGEIRGYAGPAGMRALESIYAFAQQAEQGKVDRAFVRSGTQLAGILFGFPAAQVQRTVDGWIALREGRTRNPFALAIGAPARARK